ncbi:unnamed protein product [Linum trigynum]|uniref:F-box/LRR-repeat protein 15/At3g58940/PEG3-like LRR domain-containing protein n=1 Tax=Linum trigynum TaxID=586398 RepID=A0AAV2GR86_9ROSI
MTGIMSASIFLSSLKILQLLKVRTWDFELLSRLISGCPVLETLHLENCSYKMWDGDQVLIASIPSLKNLTIINNDGRLHCPIEMEAPNLEHLYHLNFGELQFMGSSSSPLSCVHSAWVDTPVYEETWVDVDDQYGRPP